jgi:hypothetical protein
MMKGTEFGIGGRAGDETDVDTIELELKPEELRALLNAAAQSAVIAANSETNSDRIPPASEGKSPNRFSGSRARLALLLCLSVGAVLFAVGRARVSAPRVSSEESAVASAPVVASAPIEPRVASSAEPPVRFANPFDPTEVFEFAAGTSNDDARDAVAKVLSERARERLATLRPKRGYRGRPVTPPTATVQTTARL